MGEHMNRERETPNADPEASLQNRTWSTEHGWRSWAESPPVRGSQQAALDARLATFREAGGTVAKNAVQVVELLLTASPEAFTKDFPLDRWAQAQIDWLHEKFGKGNLLEAVLHLDESSPHVHALVFPQTVRVDMRGGDRRSAKFRADTSEAPPERPKRAAKQALAAANWLNGSRRMTALQSAYGLAMAPFGLRRGQERSRAQHTTIKQFYGSIERIEKAAQIQSGHVDRTIQALPEPRLVSTPNQREVTRRRQRELAEMATRLSRIAKAREQQALDLRLQLDAVRGRYEGLQALVGGPEAIRSLGSIARKLAEDRSALNKALADLRRERDKALSERDALRADMEHWRATAAAQEEEVEEVRQWGQCWMERAVALEAALRGEDEPSSGPRLG